MSDLAIGGSATEGEAAFRPATALMLGAIGIIAFVAMLLVLSFGTPDSARRQGGPTAVSRAATGFAGIVELADATGRHPLVIRNERALLDVRLTVLTPPHGSTPMDKAMEARLGKPTLLVLPKWETVEDPKHAGWERRLGLLPPGDPGGVLAPATRFTIRRERSGGRPLVTTGPLPASIRFRAPRPLQVITRTVQQADDTDDHDAGDPNAKQPLLQPLITDGHGGIVLGKLGTTPTYVLADPDLFNNLGTGDAGNAAAALALLDWMGNGNPDGIAFDVTLDGLGGTRNLLQLVFMPPFLPFTIALGLAALLAVLRGLGRFGPPRARTRAVAFGKRALLDNTAALFRMAGREDRLGPRYAQVVRERAAAEFGAPARLRDAALDEYLDRLGRGERFSTLAGRLFHANGRDQLLAAARDLHDWQQEISA